VVADTGSEFAYDVEKVYRLRFAQLAQLSSKKPVKQLPSRTHGSPKAQRVGFLAPAIGSVLGMEINGGGMGVHRSVVSAKHGRSQSSRRKVDHSVRIELGQIGQFRLKSVV